MTLLVHPAITDDSGDGQSGTAGNKAWFDALDVLINALVHSTTNTGVTPEDIIDEVVTARGSLGSLGARHDVAHNADGTHKSQAGLVTTAQAAASNMKNLGHDTRLVLWPDGDAAVPSGFTKTGAGAVVARCGSGLGDATSLAFAAWCQKLTYGSATAVLTKSFLAPGDYDQGFDGQKITIAVRCKASIASLASVVIDDGATQTRGGSGGNGTYHDGDGNDQWIYCTHTISSSATKLEFYLQVTQAGSAYFGAYMIVMGEIVPTVYSAERWGEFYMGIQIRGNLAVADGQNDWVGRVPRDCIFMGLAGSVATAPTDADDIEFTAEKSTDLSAWVDVYTTSPDIDLTEKEIDDGARTVPDGTYANRCFKAGDYIRLNIEQVGNVVTGADLCADLMFHVPMPELDAHKV